MTFSLLLVEDNPKTRQRLLDIVEGLDCRVTIAVDGLDGLNQATMNNFDVVLLDHKMPLMDGLSLLKNLREVPAYARTPLILMTTAELENVSRLAERAGATLTLSKPLDAAELRQILQRLAYSDVA